MRKTKRHESRSTNRPPMSGPAIMAPVVIAVQRPIARPCAGPRNVDVIRASELGTRNAPAAPCAARAMMRKSGSGAAATAIEAMPKPTSPMRRTRMRPNASLTDPATRMSAPEGDQVGVDDPLLGDQPAAELFLDRRQRDVDDRAVEERHERCEHGDPQHQPLRAGSSASWCRPRFQPKPGRGVPGLRRWEDRTAAIRGILRRVVSFTAVTCPSGRRCNSRKVV